MILMPGWKLEEATADISGAISKYYLATLFGWQDIVQRYRRSRLGAFWLTINMGVLIATICLIFGALFRNPMHEFLPYLCSGLIIWGFISTTLAEGCVSFIAAEGIILQVRMPIFTHIMRVVWRNLIIFAHNFVIFPIVLLLFLKVPSVVAFLSIIGLILVIFNLLWIVLILSVLCTRYRDMTQLVQNALQVIFYATPIIWRAENLPSTVSHYLFFLNPFYHLVSVVRSPLLGEFPRWENWVVCLCLLVAGWIVALLFFGIYRNRIAYWL